MNGFQPARCGLLLLALGAALTGCAMLENKPVVTGTNTATLSGSLDYRSPTALPTDSVAVVKLVSALDGRVLSAQEQDLDGKQAPVEFIAVPAIVAAGSVIGRKVGIRPQTNTDWYEVPNLWGCIVGRPGVMKSPAVQQALKPLSRLQADARREYEHAATKYEAGETEREIRLDARKSELKKRLKANLGADTSDLAFEEEAEPPGNGNQPAGDGRRKGDAMKFIPAMGKQVLDLCGANAMRLFVDRVEPEVVGEKHAAGF